MTLLSKLIQVSGCLTLCIGLQSAWASDIVRQYRFAGMLPHTQLWEFEQPSSIATEPDGSVWLADMSSNRDPTGNWPRIQHVRNDGSLQLQFNLVSSVSYPINDITLAPDDSSIWVTQQLQIQHYSPEGKLLITFGGEGSGPGQFSGGPISLAIASDGSVWAASASGIGDNNHLRHFTAEGKFIEQVKMSSCADCTDVSGAVGMAFAPDNGLWAATKQGKLFPDSNGGWVGADQLQHYATDGHLIASIARDNLTELLDVAVTRDGSVWVADSVVVGLENYTYKRHIRLQHLQADGSLNGESYTAYNGHSATSITTTIDGSVWLASGDAIQHFKADGSLITHFGAGTDTGQFRDPSKLAPAPDNSFWVFEFGRLQHFTAAGDFIAKIDSLPFKGYGGFGVYFDHAAADDFAVAKDGSLWVTATYSNTLLHLTAEGSVIGSISFSVINPRSNHIALASNGSIWLSSVELIDPFTGLGVFDTKIQHFSEDGRLIESIKYPSEYYGGISVAADGSFWIDPPAYAQIGDALHFNTDGSVIGKIAGARAIAPQANGSLWLVDDNNRVQHLAADGRLLTQFGGFGASPGQFKNPRSIATASDGSILVADSGNNRIQKFIPKTNTSSPAEYDDKNSLLYLDDVTVGSTHYQATLQLQHGKYRLLTQLPALDAYNPAASFDATTNLLSIPLAKAFGEDYQAQFKYLGDSLFELQTVKPTKP